jgi:hypothetical protein
MWAETRAVCGLRQGCTRGAGGFGWAERVGGGVEAAHGARRPLRGRGGRDPRHRPARRRPPLTTLGHRSRTGPSPALWSPAIGLHGIGRQSMPAVEEEEAAARGESSCCPSCRVASGGPGLAGQPFAQRRASGRGGAGPNGRAAGAGAAHLRDMMNP